MTACPYGLFLYLVDLTDAPVTSSFLLNHDCPFGRTPVCNRSVKRFPGGVVFIGIFFGEDFLVVWSCR